MPSIGKMAAQMTLDNQQFTAGLQASGQAINRFARQGQAEMDKFNETAPETGRKGWKVKDVKNLVKSVSAAGIIMQEFADDGSKAGKAIADIGGTLALTAINPILGIAFGMKKAVDWITKAHEGSEKLEAALKAAAQAASTIYISRLGPEQQEQAAYLQSIEPILRARREASAAAGGGAAGFRAAMQVVLPGAPSGADALRVLNEEVNLRRENLGLTEEQVRVVRSGRGGLPSTGEQQIAAFQNVALLIQDIRRQQQLNQLIDNREQLIRHLEADLNSLGRTGAEAWLAQQRALGNVAAGLEEVEALVVRIERRRIMDTPLGGFEREQARLGDLVRAGLEPEIAARGVAMRFQSLMREYGLDKPVSSPTAAQYGSREAVNAIANQMNQKEGIPDVARTLREIREIERAMRARLDQIAEQFRNAEGAVVIADEND